MINDKNKLKELVDNVTTSRYDVAKETLESLVESTIFAHFKNVLENKEIK